MSKPTAPLTWTNGKRKLRELVPWEHNPRQIKEAEGRRLLESLDTFGQIHPIAIGPGNEIYDGHQRDSVWAASDKYGPDFEVDVRIASRALTVKERGKLVAFLHRGTTGEFDWDKLANLPEIDVADLVEFGFEEAELGVVPDGNKPIDEKAMADTEHECPKCGFKW